jgi:CRISP-associated protein Cas1
MGVEYALIAGKLRNARTMLRRNWKAEGGAPEALLESLNGDVKRARRAADLPELLGVEGSGAARYFGALSNLIKPPAAFH